MSAKFTQSMESSMEDSQNIEEKILERAEARTWNDALSHPTPDASRKTSGRMALFFKSVRGLEESAFKEYLTKASDESIIDTFLIAFYIRDCRGGKGEREIGRNCLRWLSRYPEHFKVVIDHIAEYGRWDDLLAILSRVENPPRGRKKTKKVTPSYFFPGINSSELEKLILERYASQLKSDLQDMNEGKPCSLAAKWAPSENCALDRDYNAVKKICNHMNISKRVYRKNYIAPLRAYLQVVERYMCSKNWEMINYSAVPSCAMKKLKKAFAKNDSKRFSEWKAKLEKGEVKVNGKQLYPHELVQEISKRENDNVITESQWKVQVEETKKLGVFKDSLVVVDVSGSMGVVTSSNFCPMHASVALGLLISECMEGPLKGKVITFHEYPSFYTPEGTTLQERVFSMLRAPWGGSTNFQKIFQLILDTAKTHNLAQEDMPKTLYILSDMQFNQAVNEGQENINFKAVKDKYASAGYQMPNIIFWNLSGSSEDFPCTVDDNGTAMISGFSTSILKSILTLGKVDPYTCMRVSLDAERYEVIRAALTKMEEKVKEKNLENLEKAVENLEVIPEKTVEASKGWFSFLY